MGSHVLYLFTNSVLYKVTSLAGHFGHWKLVRLVEDVQLMDMSFMELSKLLRWLQYR